MIYLIKIIQLVQEKNMKELHKGIQIIFNIKFMMILDVLF